MFGPQRPPATVRPPHTPRRRPPEPARSGRTRTLPRWLLLATDREFPKTERGPISTSEPSISLCAEPGDSCGQIHPFLPTRRRSPVDRSLVAGGAQPQFVQACLPDGHPPQCPFSPCLRVSKSVIKEGSCNSGSGTGQSPCRRSPTRVLPRERKQPGTRRSRDSAKKSTAG